MAAPVPVYVSTNYATGPNQPIPVYVVNSDGGGSDSYTKAESDDKYNTKTAFYNYAGGDDTHPPAAASATYTPTNAFYAYAGGNAGAPPASAPSTYLKITDAPTIYATLVQTQALANDLVNEIANSEDLANKTQTVTGSSTEYPSCAAVSTALSGKLGEIGSTATRLTVSSGGVNATSALSVKDYGSSKGWGIQTTPANETACQIWRFNDSLGAYRAAMSQAGKNVTIDDFLRISLSGFGSGIDCALSTKPANATDCVVWSLRNSANTQVATISQSGDVVTAEFTKFKIKAEATGIDSFASTLNTSTTAVPRCSAVSTALANYVPTAKVVQEITTSTTNIPSSNAVKNYVDSHVITLDLLRYTVPKNIDVGLLVYPINNDTNPTSIVRRQFAVNYHMEAGNTRHQIITVFTPTNYWSYCSIEIEALMAKDDGSGLVPCRKKYYNMKKYYEDTGVLTEDGNAYYTTPANYPWMSGETNGTSPGNNHFKVWINPPATAAYNSQVSVMVTMHFSAFMP